MTLCGPYEVRPPQYRRMMLHKAFLEADGVGYQGLDIVGEASWRGDGSNCIHALTDTDPKLGRVGYLLCGNGSHAAEFIRNLMVRRKDFPEPGETHDWLLPALGLDPAALRRR